MEKKIPNRFFLAGAALIILASFSFVAADSTQVCAPSIQKLNTMQVEWPQSPLGGYTLAPDSNLAQLVGYFFGWGVGLGGLAVFISLIIAGIQYITSIADPGKIKEAKDRIKSSLIGLVLLLSSWAIFQIINPNLTNLNAIPEVTSENGSLALLNKECTSNTDCCKMADPKCDPASPSCPKITNPSCNPRYWECCQANDELCQANGKAAALIEDGQTCSDSLKCKSKKCNIPAGAPSGTCLRGGGAASAHCAFDGDCLSAHCNPGNSQCANQLTDDAVCLTDSDCQSNRCDCNDGSDKDTGGAPIWQKKCAKNPSICIMTFDQPELGCDVVRFYESADFKGNYTDFIDGGEPNYPGAASQTSGTLNSDWVMFQNTTFAKLPLSYQAFTYQKDSDGNVIKNSSGQSILLPCGQNACGCTIDRCVTLNSSGSGCLAETADANSGDFLELAYSSRTRVMGVKLRDSTKETIWQKGQDLTGEAVGAGKSLWCALFGCN